MTPRGYPYLRVLTSRFDVRLERLSGLEIVEVRITRVHIARIVVNWRAEAKRILERDRISGCEGAEV